MLNFYLFEKNFYSQYLKGVDKQYKYLYSYFELVSLSLKNYPFLPFLIFAGALITTATIGLPVFTS